jgi:hypothetical protein
MCVFSHNSDGEPPFFLELRFSTLRLFFFWFIIPLCVFIDNHLLDVVSPPPFSHTCHSILSRTGSLATVTVARS